MTVIETNFTWNGDSPTGGLQGTIDAIVLHHSAGHGTVEGIHKLHLKKGWWGIGYHYYIRRDGLIYRGRPEKFVGSHAGSGNNYNAHSIGICFEGNMQTEHLTDAQILSGKSLISDISGRYDIKFKLKHSDLAKTACPGLNFNPDMLIAKYQVCIEFDLEADAVAFASLFKTVKIEQI